MEEKKAKNWCDEGAVPSEPFFVARPGGKKEDDGKIRLEKKKKKTIETQ